MEMNRRAFVSMVATGATLGAALANPLGRAVLGMGGEREIKAVAFDAFPIFDPRSAMKVVGELVPERGLELWKNWFTKLFGYTWLRTAGNRYEDFQVTMRDALAFTVDNMRIELSAENQKTILDAFSRLPVWPDVKESLAGLRKDGIRLAFLSNMTEGMLRANARHNEIEDLFEFYLSTDRVRAYKPAPKAYQMGVDAFGVPKEQICFAAFAGWDAAGATWFGYPVAWVNRLNAPREMLGADEAFVGTEFKVVETCVKSSGRER